MIRRASWLTSPSLLSHRLSVSDHLALFISHLSISYHLPSPPQGKYRTGDLGGKATTTDFTQAVCDKL